VINIPSVKNKKYSFFQKKVLRKKKQNNEDKNFFINKSSLK
jgi:hypothetical protein